MDSVEGHEPPPKAREKISLREAGFRISAWAMVSILVLLSPANLVILGWFTEAYQDTSASSEVSHRLHEVVFGIFFTIALVGAIAQITSSTRHLAGMLQLTVTLLALSVMVTVTVRRDYSLLLFLIPLAGMLFFGRTPEVGKDRRLRWWALTLTALATPALLTDIVGHVNRAQTGAQNHTTHWSVIAGFGVVLLLLGLIVTIGFNGYRLVGWSLAGASIGYGVASLAYPFDASSHRTAYSIAFIVWGFAWSLGIRLEKPREKRPGRRRASGVAARVVAFPILLGLALILPTLDTPANVPHRPDPNQPQLIAAEVDRTTCLSCHVTGSNGAPTLPLGHEPDRTCGDDGELCWGGRTDCAGCHSIDPDLGGPEGRLSVTAPLDSLHLAQATPSGGKALGRDEISTLQMLGAAP